MIHEEDFGPPRVDKPMYGIHSSNCLFHPKIRYKHLPMGPTNGAAHYLERPQKVWYLCSSSSSTKNEYQNAPFDWFWYLLVESGPLEAEISLPLLAV